MRRLAALTWSLLSSAPSPAAVVAFSVRRSGGGDGSAPVVRCWPPHRGVAAAAAAATARRRCRCRRIISRPLLSALPRDEGYDDDDDDVGDNDDDDDIWLDRVSDRLLDKSVSGWDDLEVLPSFAASKSSDGDGASSTASDPYLRALLRWTVPPPILSHTNPVARRRREREIHLLTALALGEDDDDGRCDDDESLEDLARIWCAEGGEDPGLELMRAERLIAVATTTLENERCGPSTGRHVTQLLEEAESILMTLIKAHGVHWAEPLHRLGMLLFVRGRFDECALVLEAALKVKPWHVGAQRGMVCAKRALGDTAGSKKWEDKCLPPREGPARGSRRTDWVFRAVNIACGTVLREEDVTEEIPVLGVSSEDDDHERFEFVPDEEANAWQ